MGTTVRVICYKSKVLKNNECPLMLRVTKDRKLKYVSRGLNAIDNGQEWWHSLSFIQSILNIMEKLDEH
ncbi:MAG: hypothetical protein J1E95_03915 [Muribaculaceae bacterium]|nr:hypothetical protein [Muribaculaceae bacterium]